MPTVVSIRQPTRRDRLHADDANLLRQLLLPFEDHDELGDVVAKFLHYIDRQTASTNKWTFVMLSPEQNDAIVEYLLLNSKRPMQAVRVWSLCFRYLNPETGEIMLRRDEIASLTGFPPDSVSQIMGELKTRDAVTSCRVRIAGMRGLGAVRYKMNPNVATHLSGTARDLAQATAPKVIRAEPKQAALPLVIPATTRRPKPRLVHSENATS